MKVILMAAITVDGYIGLTDNHLSTKWTSKEDAIFFRSFSREVGNLVVGSKTFKTFNRKIEGRKFFVYSNQDSIENLFDNEIEVVHESPVDLVNRLESQGFEKILIAGGTSVYTQFMQAKVVNELYITVEPQVFGNGQKLFNASIEQKLLLIEIINLSDQTKVLHYKVI
ncbi:MAG: dihydrofolate reductase [Pseudomonadales bacterium]|nr:dihydrofolate reductase [Pseudomonadales bacterium]